MWLLNHLSTLSSAAVRLYYHATRDGAAVPPTGPALLVGNHPNALLDPAFLAWAAARPVRFLAKAPLFSDPFVGWLVRGSGAIPIYRKHDDPAQMRRNVEAFSAVHDALAAGAAVAIFPEGISHSEPGLAPLKTGAARIALGSAAAVGHAFPIIPIGLVFRAKDRFRSEAHVVVGAAVAWDDLARGPRDQDAVHELTERIARSMRTVTLNLARWEDESVVRTAEAVWATTQRADASPAARVARLATTTEVLARMRASGDARWEALASDVREHARNLTFLQLDPADVELDTGYKAAARWALQRLTVAGFVQFVLAALVVVLFWVPYRFTGWVAGRMARNRDVVSTYRVMAGALIFLLWIGTLTIGAVVSVGWRVGLAVLITAPAVAVAGLYALERWRMNLSTARSWMMVRLRDPRIVGLRERQHQLARRLDDALAAYPTA